MGVHKKETWNKIGDKVTPHKVHPQSKFHFDYVEQAAKMRAAGFSLKDLGYVFGVDQQTIRKWGKKHVQFQRALDEGKEVAKSYVVSKALKAACGYEYEESNEKYDKNGNPAGRSVFKKHQPPNPKLIMWLLCNFDPDVWKSEHKIQIARDETIHVKLDGKMASKQIEQLAGRLLKDEPKKKKIIEAEVVDTDPRTIP
jgi:hypothetical protein